MIDDVTAYLRSTLLLVRRRMTTMTHWNIVIDVTRLDQLYNAVIFVTFVFYSVSWINLAISKHLVRRQHKRLQRRLAKLVKYFLSRVISYGIILLGKARTLSMLGRALHVLEFYF